MTGTFKTPGNQTPAAAGLKSIATIGTTAVYGTIDFQPYDSAGNKPTRILCGGITYIPQAVRGWIKGDGTLADNATAAAGVDLVPTTGCTPAGLVMRAKITLAPSADGRIQSVTWTEDKQLPQQASVDWGSLAAAGITAPTYVGYSTVLDETTALPARNTLKFTGAGVGCTDDSLNLLTNCAISGGGGGGSMHQVNGISLTAQDPINFQNSAKISFSNPSLGNVQATIVAGSIADADLAGSIAPAKIAGTAEVQTNKNAASGYAGLNASGLLPQNRGGSGADLSATGGAGQYVKQGAIGAAFTVGTIPEADVVGLVSDLAGKAAATHTHAAADVTSGVFPEVRGGTNQSTYATGDTLYASAANTLAKLAGNIATTRKFLRQTGTGAASAAPAWDTLLASDIPSLDTSILTTGVLPYARGGFGAIGTAADQVFLTTSPSAGGFSSIADCSNATLSKVLYSTTTHSFSCGTDQTGAGGSGIVSLNGLTVTTQTFAKTDDANVTLGITSSGSAHSFAMGWVGNLANARGGTGQNSSASTGVPRVASGTWSFDAKTTHLGDFSSTPPGSDGKIPIWNQSAQQYQPGDPIVSYNYANLLNAAAATATASSAAPVRLSTFSNFGTLYFTFAGITGSPAGCTVQIKSADSLGNLLNNGSAVGVTPVNGTTSSAFSPAAGLPTGAQMSATYACGTYPTAGTVSVDYVPGIAAGIINTPTVNLGTIGGVATEVTLSALNTKIPASPATDRSTAAAPFSARLSDGTAFYDAAKTGQLPAALVGGRLDVNVGNTPTVNIGTSGSLALDATLTGGSAKVQGNAASGAADSGNPIKIGGIFNTTQPTVAAGQRVDFQATARGELLIAKGVSGFSIDNTGFNVNNSPTVNPGNTANTTPWLFQGNLSSNGAAAGANRLATLSGIARTDYAGGTALTAGRDAAPDVGTDGLLHVAFLPPLRPARYRASATVSSAATATDIAVLPGNASNMVIVTKVIVSCQQTTAGQVKINLVKRSTADTLGTSSAMTIVPNDSNYAAGASAPLTYTANPTTGTAVGNADTGYIGCSAPATAAPNDIYLYNGNSGPIVLRGTAQQLAVNLGGATVTGGSFTVTYEWIETTTITP